MRLTSLLTKIWNNIRETVVSPTTAVARISEEKELLPAVLTVCLAAICFVPYHLPQYFTLVVQLMFMYCIIVGIVSYGTVRYFFIDGEDMPSDVKVRLMICLGYAMVPWICFLPFALFNATLIVLFAGLLWSLTLSMIAVYELCELDTTASISVTMFGIAAYVVFYVTVGASVILPKLVR